MSKRDSYFQVANEDGQVVAYLSAQAIRDRWHEIEPHDPKDRQAGTRYTLVWTGKRTLKHKKGTYYDLRGLSCQPDQHSSQVVTRSFLGLLSGADVAPSYAL